MERFWKYVRKTETCWFWMGGLNSDGHGNFWFRGRTVPAHRFSYILAHGEDSIPAGQVIDHKCRNRRCVNPDHLRPLSNAQNVLCGEGHSARNFVKTHCKNGHELSGANIIWTKDGRRNCRTCVIAYKRRWRQLHPEVVAREREDSRVRMSAHYKKFRERINATRRARWKLQ